MMTEAITIPGYRIIRRLGQGGTATVYLAIQNSFEREVALKVMSPLLKADPSFSTRFLREARIVSQMHHASIVPVFDVGEHQHHHYLSMELLPGGDLRQRIVDRRCGQTLALDVCLAISSALELAHRKGFVHRDIKPQNILFREDGTPVLTDFGIARAIDVGTSLTVTGMFVGTPSYMSPEQVKGLELDGRSDLYSLGIVCYEMLTGDVPFRADSALSIALMHLSDPLPPLPPELRVYQSFLDRLTAKEKEQRFASSAEVIRALSMMKDLPAAKGSTLVRQRGSDLDKPTWTIDDPSAVRHSRPPPATGRKWLPWVAAGLAIVLVLLGAVTFLRREKTATAGMMAAGPQATVPAGSSAVPATPGPSNYPTATAHVPGVTSSANNGTAADELQRADPGTTSSADAAPVAGVESAEARSTRLAEDRRTREMEAVNKQQKQIATLLADAQTSFASGALVQPPVANAADRYRAVLELQPQHPEAIAGLQRVADSLVASAETARKAGEVDAALRLLDQARTVRPDHPRLARLQADLEERKVKLQRRAQANLEAAGEHVAKAKIYLDRQPVSLRNVAEANDHFDEAASLAASAPELVAVRERILTGYATAAKTELSANEPSRALKVLNYARKRNMSSPPLEKLESTIQQQLPKRQ